MNIPNLLTLARLIASIAFIFILDRQAVDHHGLGALKLAAIVFAAASFTDFLDGYLARKWNQVTNFGKLFDPLADKILVGSAFILLAALNLMPAWVAALLIAREFLVTGLRGLASSSGVILPADQMGKIKTVVHMATVLATLLLAVSTGHQIELKQLGATLISGEPSFSTQLGLPGSPALWWSAWIACLVLSWYSGFRYTWACRKLFGQKPM